MWFVSALLFVVLCLVVSVVVGFALRGRNGVSQASMVESREFQDSLQKARNIQQFLTTAIQDRGDMLVVKYDIDHPENVDFAREKYNPVIYFRIRLDCGYSSTMEQMKSNLCSAEEKRAYRDSYLLRMYGKSAEEMEAMELDPYDMVFDVRQGDTECEGILYYKFLCPCGLKGDSRDVFIKSLKE